MDLINSIKKNEHIRESLIRLKSLEQCDSLLQKDQQFKQTLIEFLSHEDPKIRKNSAILLGKYDDTVDILLDAYDKEKTEMQVFEFWPSDINKLFQQSGIQKKQPPKFMPGCKIDYISNTGNPPVIILPSNNSVYSITREKKDIYFKVNADSDANILYYFVDNRFLGTKSVGEAYFWQADIGSHTLTVTDNLGRSSSSKFTVDILQK